MADNVTPLLSRLSKNVRSFEEARRDRAKLRAQRRALKLCVGCGGTNPDDTGFCEVCRLERIYSGDDQ